LNIAGAAKTKGEGMEQKSNIDLAEYLSKLALVAQLSPLFSDSDTPFIQSRFAERLFCLASKAQDLARKDISFDAKYSGGAGIGVKTFVASSSTTAKVEKIAEFTSFATRGKFLDLTGEALAREVSLLRNLRVQSDCSEVGVVLNDSYYHCIVRTPGSIYVLEQEYGQIEISSLRPTDKYGLPASDYSQSGHVYFDDGSHHYMYNVAKNVLYRRFNPLTSFTSQSIELGRSRSISEILKSLETMHFESSKTDSNTPVVSSNDYLVLPLYTPATHAVAAASGINQWNARGRVRKFSEAYIPVPAQIHKIKPGFFPSRDTSFRLKLPNNQIVQASICQDGDKALMSNPNTDLCKWLFSTIDGTFENAERRMGTGNNPYAYSDLLAIGKDSVLVRKASSQEWDYEMESASIGSFEKFLEDFSTNQESS